MKKEILFLTDNSYHDAVAYCVLCYLAQTMKIPLTTVFTSKGYHDKIAAAFKSDTQTIFVSNLSVSIGYLDSYEMEQCDCQFTSLHHLCSRLDVPQEIEYAAMNVCTGSSFHLPSVMANMLHAHMGLIEFGNYIACKWIDDPCWDITRDAEVVDILNPPEDDYVSLS